MSAKAQRARKRRIKLVGGGYRYSRTPGKAKGGTMKSLRRAARKVEKQRKKRKGK